MFVVKKGRASEPVDLGAFVRKLPAPKHGSLKDRPQDARGSWISFCQLLKLTVSVGFRESATSGHVGTIAARRLDINLPAFKSDGFSRVSVA